MLGRRECRCAVRLGACVPYRMVCQECVLPALQGQSSAAKGGGAPGKQKRGGRDSCLEDLTAASLEAAWRFPPALRLFVLFLEAADSHRLNKALLR